MANVDRPFGLKPLNKPCRVRPYYIPATDNTAVFIGDCVVKVGDSNDSAVTFPGLGKFPARTLSEVTRVTAGDTNAITGVVVGVYPNPSDLNKRYRPASTEAVVMVADYPEELFVIQADGSVAADDVGLNAVLIDTHSGSTVTGDSGTELDTTSDGPASDASNQLMIIGALPAVDNDPTAANARWIVRINLHTEATDAAGVAGIA